MLLVGNVAIDGPAGAGKSTVAKLLAKKLGYIYIDTGSMYRALTWKAIKKNIDFKDDENLEKMAEKTELNIENIGENQKIICDNENVTDYIRKPEVSNKVSLLAKIPKVRKKLQKLQKNIAKSNNVVMDGRDIATSVIPDAPYKFYITASVQERALRRYNESLEKGYNQELNDIKKEIINRDCLDKERKVSPLVKAPEAVEIDTSNLTPEEVLNKIMEYMER